MSYWIHLEYPTEEIYFFNMNHRDEYHKAINIIKEKGGVNES